MTRVGTRARAEYWPALVCALSGAAVFQFLGNSTRGYIRTSSLFYWWCRQWVDPTSETQHGLLVLAISIGLLVHNLRSEPRDPGRRPRPMAAPAGAMACGLLVHVAGYVAEQARLSIVGLLLFTWGALAFGGGLRWARASVFPVAFMLFAVPLSALDSAGFWLRMWVVSASSSLAHGLGIAVLVNGTQLLSPAGRYDYDVAAACSGVRSLVALSALSLLIGYLRFRPFWLRAAMLALSLPLIYAGNVARIVAIVAAAQVGGQVWGDRVHEIMGYGVFAIVLGGVLGVAGIVGRWRPDWDARAGVAEAADRPEASAGPQAPLAVVRRMRLWAGATVSACILAASVLILVSRLPPRGRAGIVLTPDGRAPVALPVDIGADWFGKRAEVTEVERQILPPDTGFSRKIYVSIADPTKWAFVSIVLSGRDRTSIHRPELCLVGQGWTLLGSFAHQFGYPGQASGFPATVLKVEREVVTPEGRQRVPQLVAYYFVGGNCIVATHWERLMRDAWNRLAHARADRWAYVLVQTGDADGDEAGLERIQLILNSTLPSFQPPLERP
jgi:exosortase